MEQLIPLFFNYWLKIFFIFTPFFSLSIFLVLTKNMTPKERNMIAIRVMLAVIIACVVLYFFGTTIFNLFGITVDAFRVGAGGLLFMSAVDLVKSNENTKISPSDTQDIAVVPIAIPMIVGPGTIGMLLVMGAEMTDLPQKITGCMSLIAAGLTMGATLLCAPLIAHALGPKGINIVSKLTGIIVAAIAGQIFFTGVCNFIKYARV